MNKKWILPAVAVVMVIVAVLVYALAPKGQTTSGRYADRNAEGNVVIRADSLSADRVTFIRLAEDSPIELIARIGDDGEVKVALGTCQSCNGSPKAYYTQEGDLIKCNNCGLTFPLNVLDAPGGGCHPIMIDSAMIEKTSEGLALDAMSLLQYEYLFEKVAAH